MKSWILNKVDICDYCRNKCSYVLTVKDFFGIMTRNLCENHKIEWINGNLNIKV